MWNALTNTHGQDSYVKASADNLYKVLRRYILERHGLKDLPEAIDFCLKIYSFASPHMYAEWAFNMRDTPPEVFAQYVEDVMPEALKEYLLK